VLPRRDGGEPLVIDPEERRQVRPVAEPVDGKLSGAEAQDLLTEAKLKLRDYKKYTPPLQDREDGVQQSQQIQPAPQVRPDPKAETWREKNTWFGADEEMTSLALGLHEKLVRSGVDPRSDDYYQQIDKTMRKRFPDYFGEESQAPESEPEKPARKVSTVVAPAARSTSSSRKVPITASQAAIAKRLGITQEAYAREVLNWRVQMAENRKARELENRNATVREESWTPPQLLPEPNPVPGLEVQVYPDQLHGC
jgi:hypothetical protein